MYFSKLLIKDFGKFHNKEIELKAGPNLVVGGDDSGKTTVKEFIAGIIFGIDRVRGKNDEKSDFELKKPANRKEFSGKAHVIKEDKSFLIERRFLFSAKRESVFDVAEGSDSKLSIRDLAGDIDKSLYEDVYTIGFDTEDEDKFTKEVKSYVRNMACTGSSSYNETKALKYLSAEKKKNDTQPLSRRLDMISKKLEEYENLDELIAANEAARATLQEEFATEAAKRKRVARKLVENEDGTVSYEVDEDLDEKLKKLTEAGDLDGKGDNPDKKIKFTDRLPVIFGTGLLVILVIAAIVYMMPFDSAVRKLFVIFTAILVVFTIIDGLNAKGFFQSDEISTPDDEDFKKILSELEEEKEEKEEIMFDLTFAKEFKENREKLLAEEKRLLSMRTEKNRLTNEFNAVFKQKGEMEEELRAINKAAAAISQLSMQIAKENSNEFIGAIPIILENISGGEIKEVKYDNIEGFRAVINGELVRLEDMSLKYKKLSYIAMKLAAIHAFHKENLPIVIDDIIDEDTFEYTGYILPLFFNVKDAQLIILTKNQVFADVVKDALGAHVVNL